MIWTHFGMPKHHLWVATHTSIYRYGPHLGHPKRSYHSILLSVVPYVPPYTLVCPLAYTICVSIRYTIWDTISDGLQNPLNTWNTTVSSYSRSIFRPYHPMDLPIQTYNILGPFGPIYCELRLRRTHSLWATSGDTPFTVSHVWGTPIYCEPRLRRPQLLWATSKHTLQVLHI